MGSYEGVRSFKALRFFDQRLFVVHLGVKVSLQLAETNLSIRRLVGGLLGDLFYEPSTSIVHSRLAFYNLKWRRLFFGFET